MITARQGMVWFVKTASANINCGEYMTQLKVQKLLYFAQGISLVKRNKLLFEDKIYHQKYGPVVYNIIEYLKPFGYNQIEDMGTYDEVKNISDEDLDVLQTTYDNFSIYSASKLVEMSHEDNCWINTKEGEEITPNEIKKTFESRYFE